jgi:excisionase family DNA binding protein
MNTQDRSSLLSAEQVAEQLGLHVKTVLRFAREGRLKAVRIGRQYRFAKSDLAAITGQNPGTELAPEALAAGTRRSRHVEASTIVQIDAISPADAMRLINGVGGAIKGRDKQSDTPLRVDTVYDESRARLKVIVTGSLATTSALLNMVSAYANG